MKRLAPMAAERFARIAGMFGSDFDGERASAARKADSLIRDSGLTWNDVAKLLAEPGAPKFAPPPIHP